MIFFYNTTKLINPHHQIPSPREKNHRLCHQPSTSSLLLISSKGRSIPSTSPSNWLSAAGPSPLLRPSLPGSPSCLVTRSILRILAVGFRIDELLFRRGSGFVSHIPRMSSSLPSGRPSRGWDRVISGLSRRICAARRKRKIL